MVDHDLLGALAKAHAFDERQRDGGGTGGACAESFDKKASKCYRSSSVAAGHIKQKVLVYMSKRESCEAGGRIAGWVHSSKTD